MLRLILLLFLLNSLNAIGGDVGGQITGIEIHYSVDGNYSTKSFWKGESNGNKVFTTSSGPNVVKHSWGVISPVSEYRLNWYVPIGSEIKIESILLYHSEDTLMLSGEAILNWFKLSEALTIESVDPTSLTF